MMNRTAGLDGRFERLVLGFLLGALVLTGLLLYQANEAQKSYRRAVDRAMRDYSMVAAWQLMMHARSVVNSTLYVGVAGATGRLTAQFAAEELPAFADMVRAPPPPCRCLSGVIAFVRVNPQSGAFMAATSTDTSATSVSWAGDAMRAYLRDSSSSRSDLAQRIPPRSRGSRPGGVTPWPGAWEVTHTTLYKLVGADEMAVAFSVVRDTAGRPLDAFGFVTPAKEFMNPVLQRVLQTETLLPPGITGTTEPNTLVSARVWSPSGGILFDHAGTASPAYWHNDSIVGSFGTLRFAVGLDPALSRRLVQPLADWRVPVALILFLLTAGLIAAAILQLRRQSAFFRARSNFLAGVSHELRTPLTQIRLRAELLKLGKPPVPDAARRSLDIIDKEARRLSYLVDNILSFTRVERGLNRIAPRCITLDAEIAEAVEAFTPLATVRRVQIRIDCPAGLSAHLDPSALRQALLNLLDNAARYGPEGGVITVGARHGPSGMTIRIYVEDDGPGIPEEERLKIWERYYRMPRDAASHHGGSGLGLAVVADLVARHGGRAWVETPAGGPGTRVVLEFPTRSASQSLPGRTTATDEAES